MVAGARGRAGGIAAFARTEWRTRRRSHVVVAVLVATTAVVLTATFLAAARSRTAFDRLREATHASDVRIAITAGDPAESLEAIRDAPEVLDARAMSDLFVRPAGSDLFPTFTSMAVAPRTDDATSDLDTPIITEGRAPRHDRPDEIAVSTRLAADFGLQPGDDLRLESMTEGWVEAAFHGKDPGPADGPAITARVTGIARSPAEFGRRSSMLHLTPAFVDRFDGELLREDAIHARLEPSGLVRHRSQELLLLPGTFLEDSDFIDLGRTEDGLETIATALRLVGLVGGLAGALSVLLALARASRASAGDRASLVAFGWTRADDRRALALAHTPAVAVGLAIGLPAGVVVSPWAMVDLARSIDPRPNAVLVDTPLLMSIIGGAAVAAAGVVAVVLLVATRRRSPSAPRVARLPVGPPLAVTLGFRQALVEPAGRGGRASRGAIAAVIGATAVGLAALVVSSSIGRLQEDASLTGERPERLYDGGESIEAYDEVMARLEADERVADLAGQHIGHGVLPGPGDTLLMIHDPRRGTAEPSIIAGRMPVSADEVALGPATAEATGAEIGDQVTLSGEAGSGELEVVGTVLFPEGDFNYDEGAALTVDGGRRVIGDGALIHQVFFDWDDDVDAAAADRMLADDGIVVWTTGKGLRFPPGTVRNLGAVEELPRQLALLLALLAGTTLLHAAWVGVAQRARELVTLRALGLTRRTTALSSWMHTITIVVVGLVVGVPLGAVLGRSTWQPIAEDAYLVVRPILDWSWLGLVVATAGLVGLAVAWLAARWTGRLDPVTALRAE